MTTHGSGTTNAAEPKQVTHSAHQMQFGASKSDAGYTFRLWAPQAKQVDVTLHLADGKSLIPMQQEDAGWFSVQNVDAPAGTAYQFLIDKDLSVPDPASRYQPEDVHGKSELLDPASFRWQDGDWTGLPWSSTVLYELNVGTFSKEGTFKGVEDKLAHLVSLGVTAIELMPISDFPGKFGWGYDGVLPFAPESSYGRPEDLKSLIQSAHAHGVMVFLDVVYNHFGPEGNYLHAYAKKFFTEKHHTPWGAGINYDDVGSEVVRDFFIQNAIYWLEEYHFDGLRLDAVHAIKDDSKEHVLKSLAKAVAAGPGAKRKVHLVLENDDNSADLLERTAEHHPRFYTAQWDDDIHHAFHVLATGEKSGYYADYTIEGSEYSPINHLGRCLTQGFTYQGQPSKGRDGETKGQSSGHLEPTSFVSFIQNHDQIGNRAFGDRIASLTSVEGLKAISATYLLAPLVPMLYMGEEWGSKTPFCYFCDVGDELAPLVTAGRRKEFEKFPEFSKAETREKIPDPCSIETFKNSKLNWSEPDDSSHGEVLTYYKTLIDKRKTEVIPMLDNWSGAEFTTSGESGICASWKFNDGTSLVLLGNLTDKSLTAHIGEGGNDNLMDAALFGKLQGSAPFFQTRSTDWKAIISSRKDDDINLPPWSILWFKV